VADRLARAPQPYSGRESDHLIIGLAGAWFRGGEGRLNSRWDFVLFQHFLILDHVDGEGARLKCLSSSLGKWLDNVSDYAVDLAVIGWLTWRVPRDEPATQFVALVVAAGFGIALAFLAVSWWSVCAQRLRRRRQFRHSFWPKP
jgi:phosphatidylglycerophosphate synthase